MYCPNCGSPINGGEMFCGSCGCNIAANVPEAAAAAPAAAPTYAAAPDAALNQAKASANPLKLLVSAVITICTFFSWFAIRLDSSVLSEMLDSSLREDFKWGFTLFDLRKTLFGDIMSLLEEALEELEIGGMWFAKLLALGLFLLGIAVIVLQVMTFAAELLQSPQRKSLAAVASVVTFAAAVLVFLMVFIANIRLNHAFKEMGALMDELDLIRIVITPAPVISCIGAVLEFFVAASDN